MTENSEKLKDFLKKYSLDDLAKSFFVLNLWLPNISSQIKFQYLYKALEAVHNDLQTENKINSYQDFSLFFKELFELAPYFSMLEDYVPEPDWNEIKFYFENHFYKIFYGGDLINPYDYYYSFDLIHEPFEQQYLDLIKRSPVTEMKFCLGLQDYMLSNLKQEKSPTLEDVRPGHWELPSEEFWNDATAFVDTYSPDEFSPDMLALYTHELTESSELPEMDSFEEDAYRGRICCYFFLRKGEKIYPVMPRRWLSVMYDKWGILLKDNYSKISEKLESKEPSILVGINLGHFMRARIDEDKVFTFVAPLKGDLHPPHDLRYTAIHADDKLYLIYTTPPVFDGDELSKHLEEVGPKLKESADLVRVAPTRLGQFAKKQIAEFRSKKEAALEPIFIIALPSPLSDIKGRIKIPDGIEAEIMTLDQVAGIFDELENPEQLNDFVDYLNNERKHKRSLALNSYLDKFGSFKASYGVLIPGAIEPDMIMLDFGLGSNHRFDSLKDFWEAYPEENLFGHPRSWSIPEKRKTETGMILHSKNFFGYAYIQKIGEALFFINAPVHKMGLEEGGTTDTLMHALFDAMNLYPDILKKLDITKAHNKVQFFFCSSTLASDDPELSHIKHLSQDEVPWVMDSARIRARDFGIRVVFNREKVVETLQNVKDRSSQINLLTDVLKQIGDVFPEPQLDEVVAELEKEKSAKPRFGMFAVEKRASFPQHVPTVLPDEREYKLADKEIAKIAHELKIEPGTYSAKDAQGKLNSLRSRVVGLIDERIKGYGFADGLPILFAKSNALINEAWRIEAELRATRDHDKDYEAGERSSEKEKEFLHWYRVYRYVIEKFVQHEPTGTVELKENELKEILALTDRLMDLYVSSDFINYEIYPVGVTVDRDFLVSMKDETRDISAMEKEYGEEQARINLGIIGNNNDTADSSLPVEDYLNELDDAFREDFGFGLKNLINVQQVLALWAERSGAPETTHYCASVEDITAACSKEIIGYEASETPTILDFLTLKREGLLAIKGDTTTPNDLPIWEHNKRLIRFDIRPLIKIGDQYHWAPHSVERTSRIWVGISGKHKLPSEIDAPAVDTVLDKGHKDLEANTVKKAEEIVLRFTSEVKTDVFPHNYDKSISDIGDYDVLAYLPGKNILLNIESKIIDPPHSNKDSGRVQRKIFGETRTDGSFKKGYLHHVEERRDYLNANGPALMAKLGWTTPSTPPKVISLFVTKIGFWWTKHPPVSTDVNFVEIRMLDDFIKRIIE